MLTRVLLLLLVILAAGGVGFVIGTSRGTAPTEGPAPPTDEAPEPETHPEPSEPVSPSEDRNAAIERMLGSEPTPEFLEVVRKHEDAIKKNALRAAVHAEKRALERAEAEREREREILEDARRGGTMKLLRDLAAKPAHPFKLIDDPQAFAALFDRSATGREIRFPEGIHRLAKPELERGGEFPADLLIVGAGMDRTIVLTEGLSSHSEVRSLTLRDLTIDVRRSSLVEVRGGHPATIRLERCRVIGFDNAVIEAPSVAFHAVDCRFEVGYRNRPSQEELFDVDGALLARLERCTLVGPMDEVAPRGSSTTVVCVQCRFLNFPVRFKQQVEAARPAYARFDACEVLTDAPEAVTTSQLSFLTAFAATLSTPYELLELIADYLVPKGALAANADFHYALFPTPRAGATVAGPRGKVPDVNAAGLSVLFPSGVHSWSPSQQLRKFQGDLVVAGAGRDSTLIRLRSYPSQRFVTYRDLTIDLDRNDLIRSGKSPCLLRLERCRLIGLDRREAIGSVIGAVLAVDCVIAVGYGSNPSPADLLELRGGSLARIERCEADLVCGSLGVGSRSGLALVASHLKGVRPQEKRSVDAGSSVVCIDSSVRYGPEKYVRKKKVPTLPYSDINPAWGKGNAKE